LASFSYKCEHELTESLLTTHKPMDSFTSNLIHIANLTISKLLPEINLKTVIQWKK